MWFCNSVGKTLLLDVKGLAVNSQAYYLLAMQFLAEFLRYLFLVCLSVEGGYAYIHLNRDVERYG